MTIDTKRQKMSDDPHAGTIVQVSCPGKVLVAGGYAVLERPNRGLVLSTTARFHVKVGWAISPSSHQHADRLNFIVESPQYRQHLHLAASKSGNETFTVENTGEDRNAYVEQTIAYGLAAGCFLSDRLENADDLAAVLSGSHSFSFQEIMSTLDFHIQFAKCAFEIGDVKNSPVENQKSLRVVAAAKLFGLGKEATLKLWGEHYESVLADPDGTSHANIRAFIKGGPEVVRLNGSLEDVAVVVSQGARRVQRMFAGEKASEVETSKDCFQQLLDSAQGRSVRVVLCADNDFYSQQNHLKARGLEYTTQALKSLPEFLPCCNEEGETEVAKTGLGSSAAMVTSVVTGLVKFLIPSFSVAQGEQLSSLHAVAQLAHNVIQGKIGSGFDVCAAVYGSMKYTRYDPELLADAMSGGKVTERTVVSPPKQVMLDCLNKLNHVVEPFSLPPRLELMCGDVCGGSETPSMSRKILGWKSNGKKESLELWHELLCRNEEVSASFDRLHDLYSADSAAYNKALDLCVSFAEGWSGLEAAKQVRKEHPVVEELLQLRMQFSRVRELFRLIGSQADVPVEPPQQTELCDKSMAENGVILCGVPGAGGYDAVFAVVVDSAREALQNSWSTIEGTTVCALLLEESQEHPGIQVEWTTSF